MTWPLDGSEARVDLVLIQTSLLLLCKTSCSNFNKVHLHDKSREVCIKTRSTLASLPSTGQVAEQTTVKWSIEHVASQSKWQSAELDLLKLAKKRKSVWLALFRGNVRVCLVC